jgi:hypothetical protein
MKAENSRAAIERTISMPGAQKQSKAWPYDEQRGRRARATSTVGPSLANRNAGERQ